MKKNLLLFLWALLACHFVYAVDYYTKSAAATLAGNGAASANWTTNSNGTTGLTSVTIAAGDNLFILNGGVATIINTGTMAVASLNINSGGTIIHNNNAWASTFTITGLFTWNGTVKTLQAASGGSNFFNANGDLTGTTAIHDVASNRGVYLGGTNRTLSLTQLNTGVISSTNISIGLLLNSSSRRLSGNCKLYSPLIFQAATCTLDLAGFSLQASTIKLGNTATRLIKGHANSNLTISATSTTLPSTAATVITFDPSAAILNELNLNSEHQSSAAGPVTINGDLTVKSLNFGSLIGDAATRILQVNGNFTIANNGTMRVQVGGPIAATNYDQLSATGNISIGTSTTLKVDIINEYTTNTQPILNLASSSGGTISGTFTTIQNTPGLTGIVTYPGSAVTYQILTTPTPGVPPAPCPVSLTPDLPLLPSSPAIEAEIDLAVQRFSNAYLSNAEPTATALAGAVANYNALGITVNGYTISATTAVTTYGQVAFLKTFAQYLKFHPEDTDDIFTKALNTVWLVSDRMCKGLFEIDYNQYAYRDFGRSAILIPRIKDNLYVKGLFENLLFQQNAFTYFWEPNYNGGINDDHMGNSGNVTMAYVKWIDDADERYRYFTAFKRFLERFTSYTPGTHEGLKPDGSGYHHWTSYPSYMYNLNSAADIITYFNGTSFQISSEGYLRLREALLAQLMITNDNTTRFLTMAGRKPEEVATTISRFSFRNMALAGGSILGTGASDPVMATVYNRVWGNLGNFSAFGNSTVAPFNEGYFQFNHGMAGIYRKNGWVAVSKGFSDNMFGSELYRDANRFGRYQSYGAVNIIYPGNALTGNGYDVTNWDWNFTPGATVIRLPWNRLHGERDRIDELQQKRFVGSLSFINKGGEYLKAIQGTYGVFAMDFQEKTGQGFGATYSSENHNATFVFKKSVFAFDNMLICLGSNIGNNDAVNNTLTTLYQRKAITGKEQVTVNGDVLSSGTYDNTYADTDNQWVVDNFGTGFYVFAGSGSVKLTRADQRTPQHNQLLSAQNIANNPLGNYAIGYLDHGKAPSGKAYEYIIMPNATATDMVSLNNQVSAGNKPYTVHRNDGIAHIVEYKPTENANAIFGYAFFTALSGINNIGLLTSADYPCLVMSSYNAEQKTYRIAVNNPDLGFGFRQYTPSVSRQINIKIKGTNWQISQPNANASIMGTANGETTIQFTTVNGFPVEIVLSRVLTPQTISFDAIPAKTTTDAAFELIATASSGLPVSYTSSNEAVATINGSTVTIVGLGSSTITASQPGDDVFESASPVQQTLTVADLEPPVITAPAHVEVTTDASAATASNVNLGTATATDNDGVQSITNDAPLVFAVGVTTVSWTATDHSGNTATATQTVTVKDLELPTISVPAAQAFCSAGLGYQVPEITAADNCGVDQISYVITGATQRSGTGANASGTFNVGVSVINWTVTDINGNSSVGITTVEMYAPVQVTIPDVYALNPPIGSKNTLYIGYGSSTLTLSAAATGGTQGYQFTWNTGAETSSVSVSSAGTYTVQVTDAQNCQGTASLQIQTVDVSCGNKNDKVLICHNGKEICIALPAVAAHLAHGDLLGDCGSGIITQKQPKGSYSEDYGKQNRFEVYPNPASEFVYLELSEVKAGAEVMIYTVSGQVAKTIPVNQARQKISLSGLPTGTYFILVKNGKDLFRKTILKR